MKFSWAIFLSLFSLQAYSIGVKSTGYIIPQGTSVRVSEHGECRQVHNGTSSYHFFIGTKAASEWTSFRNALPTGVTLSNCEATPRSCLDIKKRNPTATSGVYTIDPDGETGGYSAFQTYCNMDVDGGGWTLVWSNTRGGSNKPTTDLNWVATTRSLPRCSEANGTGAGCTYLNNNKEAFNYFIGVDHWFNITKFQKNLEMMYEWSSDYGAGIQQAVTFNLKRSNESTLFKNFSSNTVQLVGAAAPGIASSHFTGYPLSTSDVDNDVFPSNACFTQYRTPFWFVKCWNGSIMGGGEFSWSSYVNGAYWVDAAYAWATPDGQGGGNGWIYVREYDLLSNCTEIKSKFPNAPDGQYWIDPDGAGGEDPLFAFCDMTTDGGGWTLLMNQKSDTGGYFTDDVEALSFNIDKPQSDRYSILAHTHHFRSIDTAYTFKINWPGHGTRNIWRQRTNPTVDGAVQGYRPISIEASTNSWGGLERNCLSGCTKSLMDGSVNDGDWYFAVASFATYGGGIPGHDGIVDPVEGVNHTQLWVRDDTFLLREPRDCQEILEYGKSTGNGIYWVDPTQSGSSIQVYCDMTTDGGGWTLVFNHNIAGGYFTEAQALSKNVSSPNAHHYSILNELDKFKANNRYIFRINWPGYSIRNIWAQTTNPTIDQPVAGYIPILVDTTTDAWGGLERNCLVACSNSFIDGSVGVGNWHYAIASYAAYGTPAGIPTSSDIIASNAGVPHVQLWTKRAEGIYTKRSCKEILEAGLSTGNGLYIIDPDGVGGRLPVRVYCDMTTSGGGWTRVAYMQDAAARPKVNPNFFVSEVNLGDIGLSGEAGTAASLNPEWFSKLVGTTDAMLVAPSYSATPYIDIALGIWDYDTPRCSGVLRHTGRNAGCAGQGANDNHNNEDRFNIAVINGTQGIVPNYGPEICYSGKGSCAFFFYLR